MVRRALGLFSGGLDSILAVKILQEQGIKVTAISFVTPFFSSKKAEASAEMLEIPIIVKDITEKHLEMLLNPKHGYGSTMNPCIDCHTLMLKVAGGIMEERGFDFIFTGEVLGERPMSQNKTALHIVAKESGYKDSILRPLSAKLLPETEPEKTKKVKRSGLLEVSGRQRKKQLEMAERYGIRDIPTPAGGCLLTDPGFSGRLKDLLREKEKPSVRDIELLKAGRHVRLDKNNKIIIGRNETDNKILAKTENREYLLLAPHLVKGPYCMIPRRLDGELLDKAIKMCASYCDALEGKEVMFRNMEKQEKRRYKTAFSKSNRPKKFIGVV